MSETMRAGLDNGKDEGGMDGRGTSKLRMWRPRRVPGQAMVEFALVSVFFLTLVLGTVDFGRAIYLNHMLQEGTRQAARSGKRMAMSAQTGGCTANCAFSTEGIADRVRRLIDEENYDSTKGTNNATIDARHPYRPGLKDATVVVKCNGVTNPTSCEAGQKLTVEASLAFSAVAKDFLKIPAITLRSSSSAIME